MALLESMEQLVESIKDEEARLRAELQRTTDVSKAEDSTWSRGGDIAAAELRGELAALRRFSVQVGGIVEAEALGWQELLKSIR